MVNKYLYNDSQNDEDSIEERQENEVEALKSIYQTDFQDLRTKDVWKVHRPPEIVLKLKPQANYVSESGNRATSCTVDLHIKYSENYPVNSPSIIELINPVEISDALLKDFNQNLLEYAKQLKGQEMVMELAQHVSAALALHSKQKAISQNPYSSFFEEMEARKTAEIIKQQNDVDLENESIVRKKREKILQNVAETTAALREESLRQKEKQHNPASTIDDHKDYSKSKINELLKTYPESYSYTEEKAFPFPEIGTGYSRLQSDFLFIDRIGKGGFGAVMKVKNSLDGRTYALKQIQLNPNDPNLVKKITREVKLLSCLDHENVVRYYTSWVETMEDGREQYDSTATDEYETEDPGGSSRHISTSNKHSTITKNPLKIQQDELCAAELQQKDNSHETYEKCNTNQRDWSFIKYKPVTNSNQTTNKDGYESDDELEDHEYNDLFGISYVSYDNDIDDFIVFENEVADEEDESSSIYDSKSEDCDSEERINKKVLQNSNLKQIENYTDSSHVLANACDATPQKLELQFLYIQMEYCDKQTLRNYIDDCFLYKDTELIWKMFREIVDGLLHIHSQGIIHRDLKPGNIFIHSNGHLKIGDFGLATTNKESNQSFGVSKSVSYAEVNNQETFDHTGQVGTASYVAPEIAYGPLRHTYNDKVDIYSLGIILFEMCYPPFSTGMERAKLFQDLRSKDIILPSPNTNGTNLSDRQSSIIRWLLNHNPEKRPSSEDLVLSNQIPLQEVEEAKGREIIQRTLRNQRGKFHQYMMTSLFNQQMTLEQDITYDGANFNKKSALKLNDSALLICNMHVKESIKSIFELHGAVHLQSPQILPNTNIENGDYKSNDDKIVKMMTMSGNIIVLPYTLRGPFARHIALSNVQSIRRYCIAPVFREALSMRNKRYEVQPQEVVECAFDIISPSKENHFVDAEILIIAQEILVELELNLEDYYIRIHHMALIRGILQTFGVKESHHFSVIKLLSENVDIQVRQLIALTNISERMATDLVGLLRKERSIKDTNRTLRSRVKSEDKSTLDLKQGLKELQTIEAHAKTLSLHLAINVSTSVYYGNQGHFDGMICQLVKKPTLSGKRDGRILAYGGRYDKLIHKMKPDSKINWHSSMSKNLKTTYQQFGVGISISLQSLVDAVCNFSSSIKYNNTTLSTAVDVVIYCEPQLRDLKEFAVKLLEVSNMLRNARIKTVICDSLDTNDFQAEQTARSLGAHFLVTFHEKDSLTLPRLKFLKEDNAKGTTERMSPTDLVDVIKKKLEFNGKKSIGDLPAGKDFKSVERRILHSSFPNQSIAVHNSQIHSATIDYKFLEHDKRNLTTIKKKIEGSIVANLTKTIALGNNVTILILPFPSKVIKRIASFVELQNETLFHESVKQLMENHTIFDREKSYKKEMSEICKHIDYLKFEKGFSTIVLYGNFLSLDSIKNVTLKVLTTDDHFYRIIS